MCLPSVLTAAALFLSAVSAAPADSLATALSKCNPSCDANANSTILSLFNEPGHKNPASKFCTSYIQSSTTTTTSIAYTETLFAYSGAVVKSSTIPRSTTHLPDTTTTVTSYLTAKNTFFKRGPPALPSWLPGSYPTDAISSACSCIATRSISTITSTVTTALDVDRVTITSGKRITTTLPGTTSMVTVKSTEHIHCAVRGCPNIGPGAAPRT